MIKDVVGVHDITQRLGHLFAVLVNDMIQTDAVTVGDAVRDQSGDGMQAVKPATSLVYSLADIINRKVLGESVLVFEGVMPLGIRHCARIKPAIDHFRYAPVSAAIIGMNKTDLIDSRPMQVGFCQRFTAQCFQFSQRADAQEIPFTVGPQGQRRAPEPFP